MNKAQAALEFRKAIQLFLAKMDVDAEANDMMAVASVFPNWEAGRVYKAKDVFRYGENAVGDAQLYQVLQDHTAEAVWTPDTAVSLYKPIGIAQDGYPEWVQPLGASDAYNAGDIVSYNGKLYISTANSNVWEPGVYGWDEYTA